MTERWCIPRQLGRFSLLNEIAAMGRQLGESRMPRLRVVAPPLRTYQGKQARRAAFYQRQRMARHLGRIANYAFMEAHAEYHAAKLDAIACGMGVLEHLEGRVRRMDPTDAWR